LFDANAGQVGLSDAYRVSLYRGDLFDVAYQQAGFCDQAGRAGDRQFSLSERRPTRQPSEDATAMATMLKGAGFDVVQLKRDLKASDMRRALRDFTDDVRDADVAVVYYAGHGIEINGTNYLVPVDAVLERDTDAYDEAIPLDRILGGVQGLRCRPGEFVSN
jgi:hypothetical protein